jgi:hypothetical protein
MLLRNSSDTLLVDITRSWGTAPRSVPQAQHSQAPTVQARDQTSRPTYLLTIPKYKMHFEEEALVTSWKDMNKRESDSRQLVIEPIDFKYHTAFSVLVLSRLRDEK